MIEQHCDMTRLDSFSITVTNNTCRVFEIVTNTFKYKAVVGAIVQTVFPYAMCEKILRVT